MPTFIIDSTSFKPMWIYVRRLYPSRIYCGCWACDTFMRRSPGAPSYFQSPMFVNRMTYPSNVPGNIFTLNYQLPETMRFPWHVEHFLPIILPFPPHLLQLSVIILQYPLPTGTRFVVLPCPLHYVHLTISYQFCAPDPKQ